ncbi:MAG: (2Fe-2S) ferredoxin domain-containing protein [Acidobacteria bacterium]|nr:(2Fe-2S) ferredoxin domain-containing protein [Acidobacteriota bacterium]
MNYPFEKLFLVCIGDRCNNDSHGKDRGEVIAAELKDLNKQMGRKGVARICRVSCLDLCDHGPNIVVEPGNTVYSHLDRSDAEKVYRGEMGDAPKRTDLELEEGELRAGTSAAARKR